MFKLFISLILITNFFSTALAAEISNAINAVNYFSGRRVELEDLKYNLNYYKKASVVGISGIGKTQLIRIFAQNSNYELIWFFDCNRDLDAQYLQLAKHINQSIKDKNFAIDENYANVKQAVLNHLKPKKNWLLVYDNLKLGQNNLIKDIIELEANGHIIIASQDGGNLLNAIYLQPLPTTDSLEVINKILPDNKNAFYLNNFFKGYPLLIARGSMLLKNNGSSYLLQNNPEILSKQSSSVESYMDLLLKKLSFSEKDLLYKIAVINNQSFSKNFLQQIIRYPEKFKQDLYHLLQLGLIINVGSNEEHAIFEMHEAIKEQIISMAGARTIKKVINDIVTQINNMMPTSTNEIYQTFIKDQTLLANFEKLLSNAELYNMNKNIVLSIRELLLFFYLCQENFSKCKEMVDWLLNNKINYWQLWLMNEQEKIKYASYLKQLGIYEYWANRNNALSINLINKSKEILLKLPGNYDYKISVFIQLTQDYISNGNIEEANKNLLLAWEAFKFASDKSEEETLWFLEAKILFLQGSYDKALNNINKSIALYENLPFDSYVFSTFLLKADILNSKKNYQEAYDILRKIYNLEKDKKQSSDLLLYVLISLSQSLLGLKKLDEAYIYVIKAKQIILDRYKNFAVIFYTSEDSNLASVLETEADCLSARGNYSQAITNYAQAEVIFNNIYRENTKNNLAISLFYFNATSAACKLKDKFWFNKFKREYLAKFGNTHPKSQEIQAMQCF